MTREMEKTIIFRCPEHLYNTIVSYSKKHGYSEISPLLRGILYLHFTAIMLKETPEMSRKKMRKTILQNVKKL
jgi:hypothetical protein